MFFGVKNWAKNTRLACKVQKSDWKSTFSYQRKHQTDQTIKKYLFERMNQQKILLPESCDLENFFRRVDFLTHHKIHFKSCQNPPVTHFRIPQTLTSSQHVWNSDFKRFWKYVLRPNVFVNNFCSNKMQCKCLSSNFVPRFK